MTDTSRATLRQTSAIVWAQWRIARNRFPRENVFGLIFTGLVALAWYGFFTFWAVIAAIVLSDPRTLPGAAKGVSAGLFFGCLYWQAFPILMTSAGLSLDLKRLRAFPVAERALFWIESLLRISSGFEVVLVVCGAAAGLWRNPAIAWWRPLWFFPYIAFNLFLAVGIRDLAARLLVRKGFREAFVLLFILCTALPSLLSSNRAASGFGRFLETLSHGFSPWSETGSLVLGHGSWIAGIGMLAWTVAAYTFGKWQFGVSFHTEEMPVETSAKATGGRIEGFYGLIGALLPDPIGALVEKEIRSLSRYSRFRVVFLMGFTFGIIIWFPVALQHNGRGFFAENYLTLASVYALLLVGDPLFWNVFGQERGAVQNYFLAPVRLASVLVAKNITALFFILLDVTGVAAVSLIFRLATLPRLFLEAYTITIVMTLYMVAMGNLTSVHFPRVINPKKTFGSSSPGKAQLVLFGSFALICIPVALAFLARYAFASEAAFFGVLLVVAAGGGAFYWISLESAAAAFDRNKERLITILTAREGLISS